MPEYHNPQQEPGAEKRLLLVFLLTFIGIAIMQYLMPKPPAPTQPKPAPQAQQEQQPSPTPLPTGTVTAKPPAAGAVPTTPARQASSEATTTVENSRYRITFSNKGGVVRSWILKDYKNDKGQPLDIVNPVTAPVLGYPLAAYLRQRSGQKTERVFICTQRHRKSFRLELADL